MIGSGERAGREGQSRERNIDWFWRLRARLCLTREGSEVSNILTNYFLDFIRLMPDYDNDRLWMQTLCCVCYVAD